eukprot:scaffold42848_cov30-Phaeocystis_antarctica.AAC.1
MLSTSPTVGGRTGSASLAARAFLPRTWACTLVAGPSKSSPAATLAASRSSNVSSSSAASCSACT